MSIRELSVQPAAHSDAIWSVDWSVGDQIVTGGVDEILKVWSVGSSVSSSSAAGAEASSSAEAAIAASAAARTPPKLKLAASAQTVLTAAQMDEGAVLPLSASLALLSVASVPNSSLVVCSSMDGVIRVYDRGTGDKGVEHVRRIEGASGGPLEAWTLAADPSGSFVAAGSKAGPVHVFAIASGEKVATLLPSSSTAAAASSEGASASAAAPAAASAAGGNAWVMSVAWSPNGAHVAAGHFDGRVSLWSMSGGLGSAQPSGPARALAPHSKAVRALRFSADSALLFSGSDDAHVHWYDTSSTSSVAAGTIVHDLTAHNGWVTSIDVPFASTGALPASAGAASSSSSLATLSARSFVTTSTDKKLKVWSVDTKECIASHELESGGWSVAFDPSGDKVAVGTEQGNLQVLQVPSQ